MLNSSDVSIQYLSSYPVNPYRTATSLIIGCNTTLSLDDTTANIYLLLRDIAKVSSVTVEGEGNPTVRKIVHGELKEELIFREMPLLQYVLNSKLTFNLNLFKISQKTHRSTGVSSFSRIVLERMWTMYHPTYLLVIGLHSISSATAKYKCIDRYACITTLHKK